MSREEVISLRANKPNADIFLVNKDGSKELCNIIYFPVKESGKHIYKEERVLIQIPIKGGFDFRLVPHFYLYSN